jgi:sporulation integral membrane protein YtvI
MKDWKIYIKIVVNLLIVALSIFLIIYAVPPLLRFFMPFVIGWIISMIANPLVKFLEKKVKILRKHSSAIIIILVIAAIVGAFYALIIFTFNELKALLDDMPNIYKDIEVQIDKLSASFKGIYEILPSSIQNFVDQFVLSLKDSGSNFMSKENLLTISTAGDFANHVVETFLMSIITLLSAYFFIAERDNIVRDVKKIMPESVIYSYNLIITNFKTAVGGYFKAQFKIMLILMIIMFIGFEILKVNYSFLLAAGVAFLDFLPFFGTGAVIWPWALADFILGNYARAIFLVVIYLICQIVKQILQPKMVGDSIGISPLSTLIFMFIGYRFMGVLGMIIGIPIGMIIINFIRLGMFDRTIRGFKIIIHDINEFRKF